MYSYMSTSYHANKKIWQEWERECKGGDGPMWKEEKEKSRQKPNTLR